MDLCQQFKTLSEFKSYCHLNNIDMLPVLAYGSSFRGNTFTKALEYLDRVKPSVLVETGTARGRFDINLPSICGDGGGTLIFALWCSRNNAKLYTVDIDPQCINNCKLNIAALGLSEYVEFVVSDSVEYLQNCELKELQFLFLDSYDFDYNDPIPSQMHHRKEYAAVKDKLHPKCCILIDDCGLPHGGKGRFVEEDMVKDGFIMIYQAYQHMYIHI
jgi:hypothetical protein